MSNSKHTPGPWKIVDSWYDHTVVGANKEEIIFQDGPYDTPTVKLADALLIASAPDLLEALEGLLWYVDQLEKVVYEPDDTETHESVGNARATIAKAKGETK